MRCSADWTVSCAAANHIVIFIKKLTFKLLGATDHVLILIRTNQTIYTTQQEHDSQNLSSIKKVYEEIELTKVVMVQN